MGHDGDMRGVVPDAAGIPVAEGHAAAARDLAALCACGSGECAGGVAVFLNGGETIFAIAIAAAMGWDIAIIARIVATRRMPMDWTPRHALTGAASLAIALALGIMLTIVGGDSVWGARIAPAYGVAGLLVFFSTL